MSRRGVARFFSLKWKALLSTSLVLVAVTLTISLRSYINLHDQFERHRQAAHERYARDVQTLLDQSLNRLRQLGGLIPSLPGMQQALASGAEEQIRLAFNPQWPVLQLDLGIDVVSFFDASGEPLASWEVDAWDGAGESHVPTWIAEVNKREVPVLTPHCNPNCMQFAVVPILVRGNSVGVVLVGSSLADMVRTFRQISGNDIALIVGGESETVGDDQARWIPEWQASVVALTNVRRNMDVLKAAASSPLLAGTEGLRSTLGSESFDIRIIPLQGFVGSRPAYLAVIADITDTLAEIRAATEEILVVGGAGWLMAELLLLMILWTPMSRLRLTARNLPLLAQRQFETVRRAIVGQSRRHFVSDEIDILDDITIALADRLEQLEEKVEERTRALSRRMEELSMERDFVASLLHTAQVVIVTQDSHGRILMANAFTRSLTGYSEAELAGSNFVELLFPEGSPDLRQRLKDALAFGKREHLRHESLVTCKDGSIRNIIWYHSHLSARGVDDPVMLSVGLDITERRGAETRLAWLADHDTLTGLCNRRRFQEELELVVSAARRQDKVGTLLLIDLDQFKYINDTSGHHSGDALLKVVANALTGNVVAADVVARLGGDEFAILVRECDAEGAFRLADTINKLLSNVGFPVGGHTLRISASIGIVLFPTHADNVGDLLAFADLAMYRAKDEGRGHWHLFSEDDKTQEKMRDRVHWKNKVSQALEDDRFLLHYQPIMDIRRNLISHYEVLLRMRDDDGTVIGASQFIDAAERGGMIHAVDRMVLAKAIRQLSELLSQGWEVSFSINLSGHAFNDPQLLPHLEREIEHSRVDTSRIVFEITETAAVSDFAVANSLMLAIKELGCRFALDDFGIGFSSFYYLKHLPVDYLKIDGSFIRHLPDSLDDQIIVQALSQMSAGFGRKTIAEYVETDATLELLRHYGIDYAQGYLISRPLSAEEAFREDSFNQRFGHKKAAVPGVGAGGQ